MLLVFVTFGINDATDEDSPQITKIKNILLYIEIVILFIFLFEILLNIYAVGFKLHYKDVWQRFDSGVIGFSLVLVFLDLFLDSK